MGIKDLYEISSTNSKKAFDFEGDTQLKITPPITAKNMIRKITIIVWITETPIKVVISYWSPKYITSDESLNTMAMIKIFKAWTGKGENILAMGLYALTNIETIWL